MFVGRNRHTICSKGVGMRLDRAVVGVVAALACAGSSASAGVVDGRVIRVANDRELASAVSVLRPSGGTIVLRGGRYRQLVVGPRPSGSSRLVVVGSRSCRVEHVLLDSTARVTLAGITVSPGTSDALLSVRRSEAIALTHLLVTGVPTGRSATIVVQGGRGISIRDSEIAHCAPRSTALTNCLRLYDGASDVVLADSWFHDSYGGDFIHGRPGIGLTVVRNRFERSLACTGDAAGCGHQDLIELFAGKRMVIDSNHFGLYDAGGAQLNLAGGMDDVVVKNNVFAATDANVPGRRARLAIVVGARGTDHLPLRVRIVNNTILSGARRIDGYLGSIRINSRYRALPYDVRPVLANNVLAVLERRWPTCKAVQVSVANVIAHGRVCTPADRIADPRLDGAGRPTARSTVLIGQAARRYAPARDASGRRRDESPDIGAFEWRGAPRAREDEP